MRLRQHMTGFTLIELVTVMAIAAILMLVGVPSYRYFTTSNRVSSEVNGLLGDLQFARYQAIKEGGNIIVCPSTDGSNCSATSSWSGGWIVQTNLGGTPATLRYQRAFSGTDTFTSSAGVQSIAFNREGFASGLTTSTVTFSLHDSTSNAAFTRCLAVGIAGMLTTQTNGQSTGAGQSCS
jgi:type IV fimbrial biogenesis protein FimT